LLIYSKSPTFFQVTGDLETFVAAGAMLFMLREVLHGIAGLGARGGGISSHFNWYAEYLIRERECDGSVEMN
jgi:hypothetical protein